MTRWMFLVFGLVLAVVTITACSTSEQKYDNNVQQPIPVATPTPVPSLSPIPAPTATATPVGHHEFAAPYAGEMRLDDTEEVPSGMGYITLGRFTHQESVLYDVRLYHADHDNGVWYQSVILFGQNVRKGDAQAVFNWDGKTLIVPIQGDKIGQMIVQ